MKKTTKKAKVVIRPAFRSIASIAPFKGKSSVILPNVLVRPIAITVGYEDDDMNGSSRATTYVDEFMRVSVTRVGPGSVRFDLVNKLRDIATFLAGNERNRWESAEIVIGLRHKPLPKPGLKKARS